MVKRVTVSVVYRVNGVIIKRIPGIFVVVDDLLLDSAAVL